MKKVIIAFILVFGYAGTAFAATIFSENVDTFQMNETRTLLPVTVTAATAGEITAQNGINIFMETEAQMLWDNVTTLTATGTAVTNGRVNANIKPVYKDGYKTMYIPVTADFGANESVTITGMRLRAYHMSFSARYLQMDINGDGVSDAQNVNKIEVQGTYATDATAPYPPTDFSAVLSSDSTKVTLGWVNPPDYDLVGCSVDRTRVRNGNTQQVSLVDNKIDNTYIDTDIQTGDTVTYSVYCTDLRNFSDKVGEMIEVKAATTGQPAQPPAQQPTDELSQLSNLFSYYKVRYSIKCMPSGVPALKNDSACLWARIDMVYAQEMLSRNEVSTTISAYDKDLMTKRVQYPEARYQTNCVDVATPASYCPALEKALQRVYYFIGQ